VGGSNTERTMQEINLNVVTLSPDKSSRNSPGAGAGGKIKSGFTESDSLKKVCSSDRKVKGLPAFNVFKI
jgi:hypothetical protein